MNYTTTEKELLEVVFVCEKFKSYLVGSSVVVFSDHAALKYLFSKKDSKTRLVRWILLWLRWKLTFLLETESRCELCKSIFQICHGLSILNVDCLLLLNECMQCFLNISSRRWSIRRCRSLRILEIMVCLKRWM